MALCLDWLLLHLQEAQHWEASFQVYERGTALFKFPHVADIWAAYLKSFVARCANINLLKYAHCHHLHSLSHAILCTRNIMLLLLALRFRALQWNAVCTSPFTIQSTLLLPSNVTLLT